MQDLKEYSSHWVYKGTILETPPETSYGFVYRVINNITGQMYIGRKYFGKTRRIKRKGKVNRKVVRSESDWRTYTGSNEQLNKDIESLGKENFTFEILIMGETKGTVNFFEETLQHKFMVLIDNNYYNNSIGSRKFMSVKLSEESKKNLMEIK